MHKKLVVGVKSVMI